MYLILIFKFIFIFFNQSHHILNYVNPKEFLQIVCLNLAFAPQFL